LPENDKLDGKRPALCALSRTHIGITAAALALGACVFKDFDTEAASLYESKATALYARAQKNDTQTSAFERNVTNDFYYDRTDTDNMALAAAELYRLTKDQRYLEDGKAYAPPPAFTLTWSKLNGLANYRLAEFGEATAKSRLLEEISRYENDNSWNIPWGRYSWGSLCIWMGMANNLFLTKRLLGEDNIPPSFLGVLDYTFGRNNWGIAMMVSDDLPYSVRNIYNFIWHVQKELPVGALSEGPGDRAVHDSLKKYFRQPKNSPFDAFNTAAAVFYDNAHDFMIQESTIWGQGNLILMLALASK
jgi:hypothetical protein